MHRTCTMSVGSALRVRCLWYSAALYGDRDGDGDSESHGALMMTGAHTGMPSVLAAAVGCV